MHISSLSSPSSSTTATATTTTAAALTALLVLFNVIKLSKQQEFSSSTELHGSQHSNQPGHFEFELAPNMEPPALRRPPYPPSNQLCSGSDILGGFSPKDTLCGDLNQGRVPINPLGHNIGNQPYPFELIRNKTLQFLARALPILKLEYESIPKVARLLPSSSASQQHRLLLNPTHADSPFGHVQLQQLNQRLGASNVGVPYGLLRRKRRAISSSSSRSQTLTATELSPNTSLVVSSAHSSPYLSGSAGHMGRIWDLDSSASELALITKDGYRQVGGNARVLPQRAQQLSGTGNNGKQQQAGSNRNQFAASNGSNSADRVYGASGSSNTLRASNESSYTTSSNQIVHTIQSQSDEENPSSQQGRSNTESAPLSTTGASSSSVHHQQSASKQQSSVGEQTASGSTSGRKPRISCADASSGFTAAICQAAAALIEPAERTPTWLQLAKQLGSAYANQLEATPSLWSLVSALTNPTHQFNDPPERSAAAKSAGTSLARQGIGALLFGPLSSLLTSSSHHVRGTHKASSLGESSIPSGNGSGNGAQNKEAAHSKTADSSGSGQLAASLASIGSSAMTKIALAGWASNAIAGLIDYFVPSLFQSLSGRSFARRKKPYDPQESFVDTPASLAANIRQQQLAGKQPPPTPCPSVEEYISPTFARNYQGAWKYVVQIPHEGYFTQTIQRTSCVKSRCEFTDGVCHESPRWVSLLVAEIYYPNTVFTQPPATSQQATTSDQQQQQQQQLAAQSSTNSVQYQRGGSSALDPLQMTDPLGNSYNSALMNAANELSWDPASLQQLASAYNYQLMQRSGLPAANNGFYQLAQTEPRSSNNLAQADQLNTASSDYIAALAAATIQQNPNINIQDLINSLSIPQNRKKRDISAVQQQQQMKQQQQQQQQQQQMMRQRQYAQPQHRSAENVQSMNDINSQLLNANQQQQQLAANFKQQSEQQVAGAQAPSYGASQNLAASQLDIASSQQQAQQQSQMQQQEQQANSECDGHDKLGCYVVRVYYDWFLVNGSCKCWKTSQSSLNQAQSASSSSSGNSFLRRIFTG